MRLMICLFFLFFTLVVNCQQNEPDHYDLAYYNDSLGTCLINFESNKIKHLPKIYHACISSDGKRLVYSIRDSNSSYGYIIDLATSHKIELNIASSRVEDPLWSPDGKYILFSLFDWNYWKLGLLDLDSNVPTFFGSDVDLFCPTWTLDSKTIIAQDLRFVYKFDLNGHLKEKFSIDSLGSILPLSSNTRFLQTSDGKYLIWNAGFYETNPSVYGPPEAIYIYNYTTKKRIQLTPKNMSVSDLFINSLNEILFTGNLLKTRIRNIYKIKINDKFPTVLIRNSSYPTSRFQ